MNSMQDVVQVATDAVIREVAFWVEKKPMHCVLDKAEEENTEYGSEDEGREMEIVPRGYDVKHIGA